MSSVFTSTIANALKLTLDKVITDNTDNFQKKLKYKRWMDQRKMTDNWHDDLEVGGPGLAAEKTEGGEMDTGTVKEGYRTRYIARTFALKIDITEEAMEDNKYSDVIKAARRLKRSMFKTMDIDATNILKRATNASYVGGDGQVLASASHTLPHGGTFSNIFGTAMSPSRAAMIIATNALGILPSQDGVVEGYMPTGIVCPFAQWSQWEVLTGSSKAPEPGEFNAINVVEGQNLNVVPIEYWDGTSTTNWGVLTDCDNGFAWRNRRAPRARTWVENSQEVMSHGISARWANGWSDPRCIYFSNA